MAEISEPGRGPGRTSGHPTGERRDETADDAARGERGWQPPAAAAAAHRPGNAGQWSVQERLGTTEAARRFHAEQVVGRLNRRMREFVARQEMFFLATSDRFGECHSTLRAGPPGFLRAVDEQTLVYPEYRGSGVHASLGNIAENPHAGLLLVDFERARIGLHVNGRAHLLGEEEFREEHPEVPTDPVPGRRARLWVRIDVITAHIHGATHIPHLVGVPKRTPREWGSQDYRRRGGDFFGVARARAAAAGPPAVPAQPPGPPVPGAAATGTGGPGG
uniref:pyridoxamine 5'-phosphate oxidase family protein n=1 Tax=Streptomyces lonarensis TaxID=700599 RepID=UPI0030C72962